MQIANKRNITKKEKPKWNAEEAKKRETDTKRAYARDEKRKPNYQKQIIQNAMHFMCVCGCDVVSMCSYMCIYAVEY